MGKVKTIMLVSPMILPVPAVSGGAIEQLITYLIEMNEKYAEVRFVVVSKTESFEDSFKYSKIYDVDITNKKCNRVKSIGFHWKLYRLWLKLFRNHFIVKFIPETQRRMDFFEFVYLYIAKREKVDVLVLEGRWDEERFDRFNSILGKENLYTHLHCTRNENIHVRRVVNNSISISKYVREQWVKDPGIIGKNYVLYNCADIEKFHISLSVEKRKRERERIGVSEEDFLVLYCGRIVPEKGIRELLDAFGLISDTKIKLLLIGNFAFDCDKTSEFEKEIIARTETMPSVIRRGYIPNKELPNWYALADIQIIPSIWQEGAGLVAIEGMAAGLPLITTISGGLIEYINRETSIQVPIDEKLPSNLAEAIQQLMNDGELRKKMSEAGTSRALQFSKERYYRDFVKILQ